MLKCFSWSTVKKYLPLFLLVYLPPIILLLILGGLAGFRDIPIGQFFTDPLQIAVFDSYIGLVNNLGVVLWAATMAICIFTFIVLRNVRKNEDFPKFVLFSGLFTLILLLDDLFIIHEYSRTTEWLIPIIFIFLFILIVFRFRNVILKTDYIFVVIAVIFLGISFAVDILQMFNIVIITGGVRTYIEDGCKFLGIISWLVYFTRICLTSVRNKAVS